MFFYSSSLFSQTIPIVIGEEIPEPVLEKPVAVKPNIPLPIPPSVEKEKKKSKTQSSSPDKVRADTKEPTQVPKQKTVEPQPIKELSQTTPTEPQVETEPSLEEWNEEEEQEPVEQTQGDFAVARQKELEGKFAEAVALYKTVVALQNENSMPALYRLVFLEARMGKEGFTNEADFASDEEKAGLYYYQASGFESRFLDNPHENKWLDLAVAAYQQTLRFDEVLPWSSWAKLRMARLYFNEKNYRSALQTLLSSMNMNKNNKNRYEDLSWFLLARILHVSQQHYDPLRAIKAYQKVLDFPESLYYQASVRYLQQLEKRYFVEP